MPPLFRLGVLKLFKYVFEYLMAISPPPTPHPTPRYTIFTQRLVSGHVYEVNMAIASWLPFLSIRKSKYQRDIASKMKQLCLLFTNCKLIMCTQNLHKLWCRYEFIVHNHSWNSEIVNRLQKRTLKNDSRIKKLYTTFIYASHVIISVFVNSNCQDPV